MPDKEPIKNGFLITIICIFLTYFVSPEANAFSLKPYLKGSGKYDCFPPRDTNCGPRPPKLHGWSRTVVNVLDQVTRRINDKPIEKKLLLILSPLLAGKPITESVAKNAAREGVIDSLEGFLIGLVRSSPNLLPEDKAANEKFIKDFFRLGTSSLQLKSTISALTKIDQKDLKEANDFYKATRQLDQKLKDFKKAYDDLSKSWIQANPHAEAKNNLEAAKQAIDACDHDKAQSLLNQALRTMKKSCNWDGYRYRKMENLKDCFYGEWYTDLMKPGYPRYDEFLAIQNDFSRAAESVKHRLDLFEAIEAAKRDLKQNEKAWLGHAQAVNLQIHIIRQGLAQGQLRRTCQAVVDLARKEKEIEKDLPGCTRKLGTQSAKMDHELRNRIAMEQQKVESSMQKAHDAIKSCKLDDARRLLQPLAQSIDQLWIMDSGSCRQTKAAENMRARLQSYYEQLSNAENSTCARPEGLGSKWTCRELGFISTCTRQGRSGAFLCNWGARGCTDSLFRVKHNPGTGDVTMTRKDQACVMSKGLAAEYKGKLQGREITGQRRIVNVGTGRIRPTHLLNVWQDFSCTIEK